MEGGLTPCSQGQRWRAYGEAPHIPAMPEPELGLELPRIGRRSLATKCKPVSLHKGDLIGQAGIGEEPKERRKGARFGSSQKP